MDSKDTATMVVFLVMFGVPLLAFCFRVVWCTIKDRDIF